MIQLKDINYEIAGTLLLRNISWTISGRKRIALIGPNGTGKTTLLRIMTGQIDTYSGTVQTPKNFRTGYLPQEEIQIGEGRVIDLVLTGNKRLAELQEKMERARRELEKDERDGSLAISMGQFEHEFSTLGGYSHEARAKKILSGLGFTMDQFILPLSEFSGGWQMRAYLARLLIADPDLLLLDEPTNHLDLPSLEWLEDYLLSFRGTIIFVSHDRFFIDRLADEIAELWRSHLTLYPGKYQTYLEKKNNEREALVKRAAAQREERERITRFIERFRYKNTKAPQVQSRIKMLEKMEQIDIPPKRKSFGFHIKVPVSSFKEVCLLRSVGFRYDLNWIFRAADLQIYRGEKIALVGINGAGKTTLTRLITGQLKPTEGELISGEKVITGYYAQHQLEALDLEKSVFEEVYSTAADSYRKKVRDVLGIFQFSGEDVEKPVGVLSGGEKARVSLAKILISPVNFLVMDEPTNHLDIEAKEALEEALRAYDGTLLLISHDRYFLDRIVSRVIEISDGIFTLYEGNYTNYLGHKEQKPFTEHKIVAEDSKDKETISRKKQRRAEAQARQRISGLRQTLNQKITTIESDIERLEQEKQVIEKKMSDPDFYKSDDRAADAVRRYQELLSEIPRLVHDWEKAHLELDKVVSSIEKSD